MSSSEVGQGDRPQVPGHTVEAVIGAGASAVVWSGTDPTGRRVAIKVPRRARGVDDEWASLGEQQVLLAVQHDHLVPLRAVVPLVDGREALVFDLVTGAQLGGMVRSRGHLRPGEVVTVLTPLCEALAHLHAAGGVHSDISPSNIMVTPEGRPVLLDLGAARVAGSIPGAVHGTTGFVAPEVRLGSEPGEAADVYALGAVAWFCLTGNGAPDTMMRLDGDTVVSHVGPALAAVVAAAIDPEPERRPGAAELARLFYDAVAPEPVEVVIDVDPAAALTHRLRSQADDGSRSPAAEAGRRRVCALPWFAGWTGSSGSVTSRRSRATSGARWPRPAAVAALVALPLLAAAGWALAAQPAGPPAAASPAGRPTETSPSTPDAAATTSGGTASPAARPTGTVTSAGSRPVDAGSVPGVTADDAVLHDPSSPSRRPEEALQALSDRRSAALTAGDVRALGAVHAPGSPSLASDRDLLDALARTRTRWEGLRLEVAEARFVSGSPTAAVLRARVDWTAYVVVVDGHAPAQRPADRGRVLDFALARGSDGWRLSAISAAPAT